MYHFQISLCCVLFFSFSLKNKNCVLFFECFLMFFYYYYYFLILILTCFCTRQLPLSLPPPFPSPFPSPSRSPSLPPIFSPIFFHFFLFSASCFFSLVFCVLFALPNELCTVLILTPLFIDAIANASIESLALGGYKLPWNVDLPLAAG